MATDAIDNPLDRFFYLHANRFRFLILQGHQEGLECTGIANSP